MCGGRASVLCYGSDGLRAVKPRVNEFLSVAFIDRAVDFDSQLAASPDFLVEA